MLVKSKKKMKFHKGSIVEVLSKKKDILGAWRCAQIVENSGEGYTVRYYRLPGVLKEGVDRVEGEEVRPRPPLVTSGSVVWGVGDVVEVLDDGCWRVSMIEEVLEDDFYYIQVIGSVDEFRVGKSSVRGRQEWKENKWVPMEKDSGIDEKLLSRMHKMAQIQKQFKDSVVLSKKLKRSSLGNLSTDRVSEKCVEKRRAVNKRVEHDVHDAFSFIGKVSTPVNSIGETQGKGKVKNSKKTLVRASESDVCVSSRSSVASCCVLDSDADSLDRKGGEATEVNQSKERDNVKMHELELFSYRSTLEALYACGPLNWELEAYLTNLRQKFCVSNDEHLTELKRLRSIRGRDLSCC